MRLYFILFQCPYAVQSLLTVNYFTLVQVWVRPKSEMPI